MNDITIRTIPHRHQRYATVGDWVGYPNNELEISVSGMPDWRYEFLVALHELVEWALCRQRNIDQVDVDRFDMDFETDRDPGDESEPGDDPKAPYRREHRFAENIERMVAAELGVDWFEYDKTVGDL